MLLVGQSMYGNYAEAMENSVICQLSAAKVEEHILSNPKVAVKISRLTWPCVRSPPAQPRPCSNGGIRT